MDRLNFSRFGWLNFSHYSFYSDCCLQYLLGKQQLLLDWRNLTSEIRLRSLSKST